MAEKLICTKKLDNGLLLEVYDGSRKIADKGEFQSPMGQEAQRSQEGDIWLVSLIARMNVPVHESYFSESDTGPITRDSVVQELGETVIYEKRMERHLIHASEKDRIFASTQEVFETRLAPYLAHPEFGKRYVIKRYMEEISPEARHTKQMQR